MFWHFYMEWWWDKLLCRSSGGIKLCNRNIQMVMGGGTSFDMYTSLFSVVWISSFPPVMLKCLVLVGGIWDRGVGLGCVTIIWTTNC